MIIKHKWLSLIATAVLLFPLVTQVKAWDLETSLDIDHQTLSLIDPADKVYIGEFNKGGSVGIGGHANLYYQLPRLDFRGPQPIPGYG